MSNQPPKYINPKAVDNPDRQWPARQITRSPIWCSVDLRDGNQALPNPMTPDAKLEYFHLLRKIGFKEIEVAFPSASQDDFDFTRRLIEGDHIGDDVFIMGLTQCREHLIDRTFESFAGIRRGIVHAYIATSPLHMKQVFGLSPADTLKVAVRATEQIRDLAAQMPDSDIRYEFSPEEFTDTDIDFALEICQAVFETWGRATVDKPMIMNLPATVERRPPNQYADMIEIFGRRFPARDRIRISVHSHNDQGMAVAGSEMCLLAGADRVEGTLFGHGERTGNVDLVTVANNLRVRGIETNLDFSRLDDVRQTVRRLTGMDVYYRQPYAGEYVFTAFSGSHQDAIRKGMGQRETAGERFGVGWKVPYLHIDPTDLGRQYEDLIRINSQSGKGGVAWVLEQDYSVSVPKAMHPELGRAVQTVADERHRELDSEEVYRIFVAEFLEPEGPFRLLGYWPHPDADDPEQIHGEVKAIVDGQEQTVRADGNGPVDAFVHAMRELGAEPFRLTDFHEDTMGKGSDASAIAYISLGFEDGTSRFGAGTATNIDQAAVRAIVSAVNRKMR